MKKKILSVGALFCAASAVFALDEFDGTPKFGNYELSGSVSLSILNPSVGHWVDAGTSLSIAGTSENAVITGSAPWWLLNENADVLTVLTLTDVSMKDMRSTATSNSAAAAVVGVSAILNVNAENHDVYISNNVTTGYGGALILEKKSNVAEGSRAVPILNLTANGGNITFSGNGGTGPGKAIYVDQYGGTLNFKAKAGNSITFNEVVYMRENTVASAGKSVLNIGDASGDFTGKVSFLSSDVSQLLNVTLNSGTFEFVLTSNTGSNVSINSLNYIDGDFSFVVSDEGHYSFTLAASITGNTLDESIFGISDGFKMENFEINGTTVSFDAVAIPEASTFAALFGLIALAFAAYRRKK